ncbi:MAG: Hpt domain-containing protein [Sphingobacteriales bacterium]|nr:Hpt domain-containing protein [Sphingobacteriales bacterium]
MDKTNIVIDLSYLKEVSSDNNEFMIEMIDIFQAQTPGYVESLSSAILEKNWSKIAEMAHKIKPTLSFMGVEEAKEEMASIETRARNQEDYEGIVADFKKMQDILEVIYVKLEEKKKELQS